MTRDLVPVDRCPECEAQDKDVRAKKDFMRVMAFLDACGVQLEIVRDSTGHDHDPVYHGGHSERALADAYSRSAT